MKILSMQYFKREYLTFRAIMGSPLFSKGKLWDALMALLHLYLKLQNSSLKMEEKSLIDVLMKSLLVIELPMVMSFRLRAGIK